jgi:uracil-DNA glycosylase
MHQQMEQLEMQQTWASVLGAEQEKSYYQELMQFLNERFNQNTTIFPPKPLWFEALKQTPFADVKVVILGQDPYHGPKQAHGLCFSVLPGVTPPPSLKNVFKEIADDLNWPQLPKTGCLTPWAQQGVLLLNTTLSVEQGKPQSHAGKGWEIFTNEIIDAINRHHEHIVFLLWGSYAQQKIERIDQKKHHILKTTHPSPFSSYRGFLGSKPFSKTNTILTQHGKTPITWESILVS